MEFNETTVSEVASKLGLTPEVFTKSLLKDTPEAEVTPVLAGIKGLEVHRTEDFATRIERERKEAATEATNNAKGGVFDMVDQRIFKATGIAKLPEEARDSLAYAERAYKEKFGVKADESTELRQLRETIEAKDALLVEKTNKLQELEVGYATERKQAQINASLDKPILKLTINVPEDQLAGQQEFVKWKFNQAYSADIVEGKTVFTDKATGKVVTDPNRAGNPIDAETLIAQFAPKVVSLKVPSQRSGAGIKASGTSNNQGPDNFGDFASIDDYKKHLTESGVTLTSKAGQEKITAYIKARDKK
jgi:hypothetical protein